MRSYCEELSFSSGGVDASEAEEKVRTIVKYQ